MTSNNVTETEPVEPSETAPSKSVDDRLIDELVGRAQAEGLQLTGEGGLLQQLTKRLLESALEGEITDHLGYDKHDPAGKNGGNSRNGTRAKTVLTDVGPVEITVPRDRECRRTDFSPQIRTDERPQLLPQAVGQRISVEIDDPSRDTHAMSPSTSSEPIGRGWDEPWYRVQMENFQASFLPSDGEDLDEVCNVDVFMTLKDGSCWTATVFTVAEVERLMNLWAGTDEALGGRYFWVSDGLIVRDPGIDSMTGVIAGLIENGEFSEIFQRVIND